MSEGGARKPAAKPRKTQATSDAGQRRPASGKPRGRPRAGVGTTAPASRAPASRVRKPVPPSLPGLGSPTSSAWPFQVRTLAEQLLGMVGSAAELSFGVGSAFVRRPSHRRALQRAGAFLRDARETAGLTVNQVSTAIDLKDPELLDLAESGKMVLPFEVLLRLAALLARNDPIPFLMQFVRNYSPSLWKTFEDLGIGKLVLHAGREHEFINLYRSRDAARRLSDEEFAKVLAFTDAAFGMALDFATDGGNRERTKPK